MAQTPEGKVKDWLRIFMKARYPNAWHYAPPAGPFGAIGVADDIWVIKAGDFQVFVAIESKADESKTPTEPQIRYLKKIQSISGIAAVMKGKDRVRLKSICDAIDAKIGLLENFTKQIKEIEQKANNDTTI
jgi:hypothetical protein